MNSKTIKLHTEQFNDTLENVIGRLLRLEERYGPYAMIKLSPANTDVFVVYHVRENS